MQYPCTNILNKQLRGTSSFACQSKSCVKNLAHGYHCNLRLCDTAMRYFSTHLAVCGIYFPYKSGAMSQPLPRLLYQMMIG